MAGIMAKRKRGEQQPDQPEDKPVGKRYPSRDKLRYVAIPLELYEALQRYADSRSDEDDKKSLSWAARVGLRKFLTAEGFYPPKK